MTDINVRKPRTVVLLFLALAVAFGGCKSAAASGIAITSPPNGAEFKMGDSIPIDVSTDNTTCIGVIAILQGLAMTEPMQAPPYHTVINLPSKFSGTTEIIASCKLVDGSVVMSAPININVVSGSLINIGLSPNSLRFKYIGQNVDFLIYGMNESGKVDLTSSSLNIFSVDNPAIVSVSSSGSATALSAGSTTIRVKNGATTGTANVTVPQALAGDLNADRKVDIDDIHELTAWLNTSANVPNDARDLNHDGKIDALDARILTTLCTYPRCATHP